MTFSPYPTPMELAKRLAPTNPRLAYQLAKLGAQGRLIGFQTIAITFETGTTETPLEQTFPTTLGEDFYVIDIRSTVQRPKAFAGSIFKGQSDFYNALGSGVWTRLQVVGGVPGRRYVINDQFTPLEIIAPNTSAAGKSIICGLDAVLDYSQSVRAEFVLKREYTDAELPLEVVLTFMGWSLGAQGLFLGNNVVDFKEAVTYLAGVPELDGIKLPGSPLDIPRPAR